MMASADQCARIAEAGSGGAREAPGADCVERGAEIEPELPDAERSELREGHARARFVEPDVPAGCPDDVEHGEHRRPDSRAVGRGVATRVRRACRATGRNGRHQPTLSAIRAFTSFRTSEAGS